MANEGQERTTCAIGFINYYVIVECAINNFPKITREINWRWK